MISGGYMMIKPDAVWLRVSAVVPYSTRHVIIQDKDVVYMMTTLPCGARQVEILEPAKGKH